jgi:mono/diheme cytochrome c family protein
MKKILVFFLIGSTILACGGDKDSTSTSSNPPKSMIPDEKIDDGKGIGEFTAVELNDPLDAKMITDGQAIYELKCSACHKLGANRVVGPGFKGVTERRKPEWIMNMVTNVEVMLDEDPEAQKLFEECLTRMPNQNLSATDARAVLEFLYNNDAD